MHNIFIWLKVCAFLQTLVDLKWAGCGLALVALKRTGCDVRQMECQASNVTANVQSDNLLHGYMLPVFFVTDQLCHPPSVNFWQSYLKNRKGHCVQRGQLLHRVFVSVESWQQTAAAETCPTDQELPQLLAVSTTTLPTSSSASVAPGTSHPRRRA